MRTESKDINTSSNHSYANMFSKLLSYPERMIRSFLNYRAQRVEEGAEGFSIVRDWVQGMLRPDFSPEDIEIVRSVKPFTMTSPERICALLQAVRYVVNNDIPGSIVECGVWKGGSMMAAAYTLASLGRNDVELFLFDTYEGMPKPTDVDVTYRNTPASQLFHKLKRTEDSSAWCYASVEEVRSNLAQTGYEATKIKLIKGKVEDTLPAMAPEKIAILRLDTDFYESTTHELIHLFPRLSAGGVLIVDDYGCFMGVKKAVDEYFEQNNVRILLNRIDWTGRIAVKS